MKKNILGLSIIFLLLVAYSPNPSFAATLNFGFFIGDLDNPAAGTFGFGDSILHIDTLPPQINYMGTDMVGNTLVFGPNGSARFTYSEKCD